MDDVKYRCNDCGHESTGTKKIHTTYEAYYGAPIPTHTPLTLRGCERCGSDDLEEVEHECD